MMSSSASLLPVPPSGTRSTASNIAERHNVWAQHQLQEKKSTLDRKLHDTVVKMNVDKLEVIQDLVRMRKSASTGSLESLERERRSLHSDHKDSPLTHGRGKASGLGDSLTSSTRLPSTNGVRRSLDSNHSLSPSISKRAGSAGPGRVPVGRSGIVIRVSGDWSSSEDEDHSTSRHLAPPGDRDKQRLSAHQLGRSRNSQKEGAVVENVKRRFAKQVKAEPLITKDRLKAGKAKT